jgi:hypothetical protein
LVHFGSSQASSIARDDLSAGDHLSTGRGIRLQVYEELGPRAPQSLQVIDSAICRALRLSTEMFVAFLSSRVRITVPSRIRRTMSSSARLRAAHASQSTFTLRHARLTTMSQWSANGSNDISDGHTLPEALEQVAILTGQTPALAVADCGYRGHGVSATRVPISGTRRGLTPTLKRLLRRRSAIEPEIGHMKTDGRLSRCPLKGTTGDAIFAVLCGCGHNIRKILAHIRRLWVFLLAAIPAVIEAAIAGISLGSYQNGRPEVCSA